MELCKIQQFCPAAEECHRLNYRGSDCAHLRAKHGVDYDPADDEPGIIIVYYKDAEGRIVQAMRASDGETLSDLQGKCAVFNSEAHDGKFQTAAVEKAPLESLTAFLFEKAEQRSRWSKDDVQNALDAIDEAKAAVLALRNTD